MSSDVRVCFLGDSFVAGVGDPHCLGWVGRLAALSHARGLPLTAYNLGVRRETSSDVLARWQSECAARLPEGCDSRVVIAFGVNDTTEERGRARVRPEISVQNLRSLLLDIQAKGWQRLVVGPPPIAGERQNWAIAALDNAFSGICGELGVHYVSVLPRLLREKQWMQEVRDGDGAHPAAGGYDLLAELLVPTWTRWLNLSGVEGGALPFETPSVRP